MDATLVSLLQPEAVPMETLHARYGALLKLVEKLIGVIPNCDPYLEIWPPAFRTYNVMVPNFLNLPFSLWGAGAPKDIVGLCLYVASRTAGCAYCSAHTSSFALRRGASPEKVAGAVDEGSTSHGPAERAAIDVARSLSRVPTTITDTERSELARHFTPAQVEWIVLGISMMGFLNKFMDAVGVELEGSTVDEVACVITPSGWSPGKHARTGRDGEPGRGSPNPSGGPPSSAPLPSVDGLGVKLGVVPFIPSALALDGRWTAGVPKRWPDVGEHLRERTGHDFPLLGRLTQGRAIRAIAVMIRDNLDPESSVLGLPVKVQAGMVYATVVGDAALAAEVRKLAGKSRVPAGDLDAVVPFAKGSSPPPPGLDDRAQAALLLARAASPSPAVVSREVVEACTASKLPPAAIVELVSWLSVLQMVHRLAAFYPAA